jgi:dihydrodipicolinate synthase/N-acetylneuraminate lyase
VIDLAGIIPAMVTPMHDDATVDLEAVPATWSG